MPSSRAIVVLGMHRNGTSLLTKGLEALGVYLGDDLCEAKPDNPTGYWENRRIVQLNERLLKILGIKWDSCALIGKDQWRGPEITALHTEAVQYLQTAFMPHPLWGFKDPRTLRLLPFWTSVFQSLGVGCNYVVINRNPLSVAGSLKRRQGMKAIHAHLLWLAHMVPNLNQLNGKSFVVVDYDLLMSEPRRQLERIAQQLKITVDKSHAAAIKQFADDFLDPDLRHNFFARDEFDAIPRISPVTRDAYLTLYGLATDRINPESPRFWSSWESLRGTAEDLLMGFTATPERQDRNDAIKRQNHPLFSKKDANLFVIIGFSRTGASLLHDLLNSHAQIMALPEILAPSMAASVRIADRLVRGGIYPFDNFLIEAQSFGIPFVGTGEAEALLDQYFEYIHDRVRNYSANPAKRGSRFLGVDIKHYQLQQNSPPLWDFAAPPFLLAYLKSRGVTLIHTTRSNSIHYALSAMVAEHLGDSTHLGQVVSDHAFRVDVAECMASIRRYAREDDALRNFIKGFEVVTCCYEDLCADIARAGAGGEISEGPGPLHNIATAFRVPFQFRFNGWPSGTHQIPYSESISNWAELMEALRNSEFAAFASDLEREEADYRESH